MKKHILYILMLSLTTLAAPVTAAAMSAIELVEVVTFEATIDYSNRTLHIGNASGEVMRVYDITGAVVMSVRITSDAQKIEVGDLKRGCYIVKVGKTVRKIYVK